MKSVLFLSILLGTLSAYGQNLEFSLVPTKAVKAGEAALIILPVRVMEESCAYQVETAGEPNYPVEHPLSIGGQDGVSSVNYLPFTIQIPSSAPSGQIYELEASFIPNSACGDQEVYKRLMSVEIRSNIGVVFDPSDGLGGDSQTIEAGVSSSFKVLLRNSGNTELDLSLEIENLTPNVSIRLDQSRLSLAPDTSSNARVFVDFSGSGADFASFKVLARSEGRLFLSKNYKIRRVKGSQSQIDGRALESSFYLTNEFFSEGERSQNHQNAGLSISGELSDFYALSLYAQSNYLGEQSETKHFEVDLENYDNFRVTLGSSLNPLHIGAAGTRQLRGIRAEKEFFKDMRLGVYHGEDRDGQSHIGSYADWNQSYKNRFVVFWDKNTKTGFDSYGVSGEKYVRMNKSLAIAPSLVVAKKELLGNYSRLGLSLNALIAKRAPLQLEVARQEDARYLRESASANLTIPYERVNLDIGIDAQKLKVKKNDEAFVFAEREELLLENYFKINFPIIENISGQASLRYQRNDQGESGLAPEIFINANTEKMNAWVRVGRQILRNYSEETMGSPGAEFGFDNYAKLDARYQLTSELSLYGGAEYTYNTEADYDRSQLSFGLQKRVQNDSSFIRLGLRSSRYKNFYQEEKTESIDAQYFYRFAKDWNLQVGASADYLHGIDGVNYQANLGIYWTPSIPVHSKVESLFGGKSTASLSGRVCLDYNLNSVCDPEDGSVKGVAIRLAGLRSVSADDGVFTFKNLEPKRYILNLDKNSLPANGKASFSEKDFLLKANDNRKFDIPLRWSGSLKVIVFEDENGNGKWESDTERKLPNVEVALKKGQLLKKEVSTSLRPIVFNNLEMGEYQLSISKALRLSEPVDKDGVLVSLPSRDGNWIYLGLRFSQEVDEVEDSAVVTTLEDSLVFSDYPVAWINVDDPAEKVRFYSISCGAFTSKNFGTESFGSNFTQEVDVKGCLEEFGPGKVEFKLTLYDSKGEELNQSKHEIIIR